MFPSSFLSPLQAGFTLQDECGIYYNTQFSTFAPDCFGAQCISNLTASDNSSSNVETCVTSQACGDLGVALNLGSPYDMPAFIVSEEPIVADAHEFGFIILASIQGDDSNLLQSQPIISNFDPAAQTGYFLSCEPGSGPYGTCEFQLEVATTHGMLVVESGLPAMLDEFALISGCYDNMGTASAVDDEITLVIITSTGRVSVSIGNGDVAVGPFATNMMEPLKLGTDPSETMFFTGILDEFYQFTSCPSFEVLEEIASADCFGLNITASDLTDMVFGAFDASPSFYSLISPIYQDMALYPAWVAWEFNSNHSLTTPGSGFPMELNGEDESGSLASIMVSSITCAGQESSFGSVSGGRWNTFFFILSPSFPCLIIITLFAFPLLLPSLHQANVDPFGGLRLRSNSAPINAEDYLVFYLLAEVGKYHPLDIIISNQVLSISDSVSFPLSDFGVVVEGGWVFFAIPLSEFGVTFGFGLDAIFYNRGHPTISFRIDNVFLGGFHPAGTPCLTDTSVCLRAPPAPPVRVTVRRVVYEDDALEDGWQDFSFGTTVCIINE